MEWKWLANAVADRFNRMRTEIDLSLAYNKTPQCVGGHRRQKSMNSIFFFCRCGCWCCCYCCLHSQLFRLELECLVYLFFLWMGNCTLEPGTNINFFIAILLLCAARALAASAVCRVEANNTSPSKITNFTRSWKHFYSEKAIDSGMFAEINNYRDKNL